MIIDNWIDWAKRVPDPTPRQNGFNNPGKGITMHSVEGYAHAIPGVLDGVHNSWHFTILFDGTLWQHYPMNAQCWHAGNPDNQYANDNYIAIEHEGKHDREPTLTDKQIDSSKRLINEIADFKGFELIHGKTIFGHGEVGASSCPNGRIPWDILLEKEVIEMAMVRHNAEAKPEFWHGKVLQDGVIQPLNVIADLNLPPDAKSIWLDLWLESGMVDVLDGGSRMFAGAAGGAASMRPSPFEVKISNGYCDLRAIGGCKITLIGCVGYAV